MATVCSSVALARLLLLSMGLGRAGHACRFLFITLPWDVLAWAVPMCMQCFSQIIKSGPAVPGYDTDLAWKAHRLTKVHQLSCMDNSFVELGLPYLPADTDSTFCV